MPRDGESPGLQERARRGFMGKAITGIMSDGGGRESFSYKGRVIIEWPVGGQKNSILPGVLTRVLDTDTGELIPATSITLHVNCGSIITADIGVFLDEHGEILRDMRKIAETDQVPAMFPFLVSGMRIGGGRDGHERCGEVRKDS